MEEGEVRLSFLRKRFTIANMVAVVALVLAMSGGALAASKYLITSTNQISPKVIKKLKGLAGPAGPAGKEGKAGANGTAGTNGTNGTNGTAGTNGESVTPATLAAKNAHCAEGGAEFSVGGSHTYACNGKEGKQGNPAEFPTTLPAGRSEVGSWSMTLSSSTYLGAGEYYVGFANIQYSIPIAEEISASQIEVLKPGEEETENCPGEIHAPKAKPGYLCLYSGSEVPESAGFLHVPFTYTGGVNMIFARKKTEGSEGYAAGTWAMQPE